MQKYIIGNWKMAITRPQVSAFVAKFATLQRNAKVQFGISAPFVFIDELTNSIADYNVWVGAQNVSEYASGAYTGEICATMLRDSNTKFCLVGHSERRHTFGESDEQVNSKITRLLEQNITPLLCIGETLQQFENGNTLDILRTQIQTALSGIDKARLSEIIIAYEPVWAIGTGKTPTIQDIQNTISFIKQLINEQYEIKIPVLYGGSVNVTNASQILSIADVDGALIGGASLDANSFVEIANSIK